uniref:EF-hand domain-containing protein n=1 Tax=Strombidium inclinatum TaxID=197538 RepID=A0A7S3IHG5_9SPIT|mmetsp:Transcript_15931/g.24620  ORF Transcript_15931/g.24620 Transcript_15931/m.24620 type:complete len:185 (+) Transcript_15931:65-619(+)|eukprot:CAMPEP_0170478866 /NCGR_PEP_ID=MMETSP0208-20121228/305_1 /TAXON_ID=197538 /ORGANISM="Strombidium inclinatum, Strain S3" /LENGTH=184 /DNA_ID=CAMNT_0010751195 /DNA_START=40 /DNA_END=594 /DNA_ORIENTATION=-
MKNLSILLLAACLSTQESQAVKLVEGVTFAPPAKGPYASDTDHLSAECYGADEDDILYDVFERYRVEEKNPMGAGTGIWKLPKWSGYQWAGDAIRRFHVMDEDKIDAYLAANFDNFWAKYDNNGTGEIYESEGETFMRALLGPNNRFRLAPGAITDMDSSAQIMQNQFSASPDKQPFKHRYELV